MKTKIVLIVIFVLIVIQFIPAIPENEPVKPSNDFISIYNPPTELAGILKDACYNCHSDQTDWPWYAHIAPVSFWIGHHVKDGRHHLNFSEWGSLSARKKNHELDEMAEHVKEKEMPLESYTWLHSEARLTPDQREELVNYFNSLQK